MCKLWVVSCVVANVGHNVIVLFVKAASALHAVSTTAKMWLGPQGNNYQCLQHGLGGGFCNQASPAVNHDYEAWSKSCASANLTLFVTALLVVGLSVLITLVLCLWALFVIFTKRPTKVKVWQAWHVLDSVGESVLFVLGVIIFITKLRHYLVPSAEQGNYYGSQLCTSPTEELSLSKTRCGDDPSRIWVAMLVPDGERLPCVQFNTLGTHGVTAVASQPGNQLVGACMRIDNFYPCERSVLADLGVLDDSAPNLAETMNFAFDRLVDMYLFGAVESIWDLVNLVLGVFFKSWGIAGLTSNAMELGLLAGQAAGESANLHKAMSCLKRLNTTRTKVALASIAGVLLSVMVFLAYEDRTGEFSNIRCPFNEVRRGKVCDAL